MYGRAARFRRAWYGRHPDRVRRLARPVVSVGNLVVGGSGKTPVVAAIARLLLAAGEQPVILSRGYGRRHRADGVVVVSDGHRPQVPAEQSGDEPQMLARTLTGVPILVSPDRYLAGCLAERRFGCTVHLLDDGFQHLQLARDVNLLVMSRRDVDESVMPAGRLREPLDAALRRRCPARPWRGTRGRGDGCEYRRDTGVSRAGAPGRATVSDRRACAAGRTSCDRGRRDCAPLAIFRRAAR